MRSSSRFFVFVVMFAVAVPFFYTIETVGVVLGTGRRQFRTVNPPFLGPEGESGAVPEPPGDPAELKISDTC